LGLDKGCKFVVNALELFLDVKHEFKFWRVLRTFFPFVPSSYR